MLNRYKFFIFGTIGAVLMWPISAAVDAYFFHNKEFIDALLYPSPAEIYFRITVTVFLYAFSLFAHFYARKLERSEAQFSGILELARDAIISIDKDQRIILYNQSAEEIFGHTQNEIMGESISLLFPEYVKQVSFIASKLKTKDLSYVLGLRKSGEEFPAEASFSTYISEDKEIITVILHDVTERYEKENLLRKLSQAVEHAGEIIVMTDLKGVVEYINPAFTKTTGYLPKDIVGQKISLLKSNAQDSSFYKQMWKTIAGGEVWQGTLVDKKKDGSFYPAIMSVAPIQNEEGEVTHYVSIQRDMTEHQQLEEQLLQSQKMEAMGTLVGGIAHDFNNILAGMAGNIFLVKESMFNNPDAMNKLENIELLSCRAADMIQQLLTFARRDSVKMKPLLLTSFCKEALKLAQTAIPESVNLTCDITTQDMYIKGDTTQLQQLVMNLLNNSRDAVASVRRPAIFCQLEPFVADDAFREKHIELKGDKFAKLTVSDNGHGIPLEKQDKIFDPFFTTKLEGEGTGLGLSMVFGSVARHNGVVELESEPEKGATFHIYLPLEELSSEVVHKKKERSIQLGEGETILVVDDEESVRNTTSQVLSRLGYNVLTAANGAEALETFKLEGGSIDLLISDLVMPTMGGLEMTEIIREIDEDIPVIFVTGYDKDHIFEDGVYLDKCKVLAKPFSFSDLSQLIRTVITT